MTGLTHGSPLSAATAPIDPEGIRGASVAAGASGLPLAVVLATAVAATFVWSGTKGPLPAAGWAAALLFLVVEEDVRRRRIPNWITLPALAIAVALAILKGGVAGGATALIGAAVPFALLFPLFLLRGIGAGDVKALMVLGALWGPTHLLGGLWWMLAAGGVLAIGLAAAHGALVDGVRRWAASFWTSLVTRRLTYFGPDAGAKRIAVPFGLAMGLGASAYQLWGLPWM